MIASTKGYLECVKILLEHNADANKAGTLIFKLSTHLFI